MRRNARAARRQGFLWGLGPAIILQRFLHSLNMNRAPWWVTFKTQSHILVWTSCKDEGEMINRIKLDTPDMSPVIAVTNATARHYYLLLSGLKSIDLFISIGFIHCLPWKTVSRSLVRCVTAAQDFSNGFVLPLEWIMRSSGAWAMWLQPRRKEELVIRLIWKMCGIYSHTKFILTRINFVVVL